MLVEEVGDEQVGQAVAVGVAVGDAHVGLGLPPTVDRDADRARDVLERPVALVTPEDVLFGVIRDEEVDPAVPVQVGGEHPHASPLAGDPGGWGDVGEPPAALVPVEDVGLAVELARRPVIGRPGLRVAVERGLGGVETEIVGDEEVEVAVAIIVEERRAEAPEPPADARLAVTSTNLPPSFRQSVFGP